MEIILGGTILIHSSTIQPNGRILTVTVMVITGGILNGMQLDYSFGLDNSWMVLY